MYEELPSRRVVNFVFYVINQSVLFQLVHTNNTNIVDQKVEQHNAIFSFSTTLTWLTVLDCPAF